MLVFLVGLVVLVLMVLALGWDTSNWFLGHRALDNLADGVAIAAADDISTDAYYRSGGHDVRVLSARATRTAEDYLRSAAGDSGLRSIRLALRVDQDAAGATVTVRLAAPAQVVFLGWLGIVPRDHPMYAESAARPERAGSIGGAATPRST